MVGGDEEYQVGSGSLWFRLLMSEASDRVRWASRCRDCSRTLIWSCEGVVMVGFGLGVEGWSVKMMLVLVELRRVFDRRKGNSSVVYLLLHY